MRRAIRTATTPGASHPLEASVRRGWRESSKRSSASVGAGAPFRGKGIAGSRPSGRSLSGNAIVARVARLGAGAPLSLGASTSDELLGTAEIRTPAFLRSARARGIVRSWRRPRCRRGAVLSVLPRDCASQGRRPHGPLPRALAYAARGVHRTASRCCVSSRASALTTATRAPAIRDEGAVSPPSAPRPLPVLRSGSGELVAPSRSKGQPVSKARDER